MRRIDLPGVSTDVHTTVVIPAFRGWATLPRVLDALVQQLAPEHEVILVDSSPDAPSHAEVAAQRWPWLRVIALDARSPPGRSRNIGATRATGDLVAFLDADAVPESGWLENLEGAIEAHQAAVAGAIENGTPDSAIGTAGYLLEFSEWLPDRRSPVRHAAGCNLLVRRQQFLEAGGMPEDMWQGEDTASTVTLYRNGTLGFEPTARVRHLNRTGLPEFLRRQYRQGAAYGDLCRRGLGGPFVLTRPLFLPVTFLARSVALFRRIGLGSRVRGRTLRVSPLLILGMASWCVGVVTSPRVNSSTDPRKR